MPKHIYKSHNAERASLKLKEILAKIESKEQTQIEILKSKPAAAYAHSDVKNAREVLARLQNRSARPGIASIEIVSREVDI